MDDVARLIIFIIICWMTLLVVGLGALGVIGYFIERLLT
jgi:hypothetical protein